MSPHVIVLILVIILGALTCSAKWKTVFLEPDGVKWNITDSDGKPIKTKIGDPLKVPDTGDSKCVVEKKKYCVTQVIAGMKFTNCGTKLVMTCVNIDSTDGRS